MIRYYHNKRGQALVEFTMILPVFLLVLFTILQFGLGFFAYLTLNEAAREGARAAAVTNDVAAITTKVQRAASTINGLGTPVITYEDGTRTVGNDVTVSVSAPVPILLPLVNSFLPATLTAQVVMRVEN